MTNKSIYGILENQELKKREKICFSGSRKGGRKDKVMRETVNLLNPLFRNSVIGGRTATKVVCPGGWKRGRKLDTTKFRQGERGEGKKI